MNADKALTNVDTMMNTCTLLRSAMNGQRLPSEASTEFAEIWYGVEQTLMELHAGLEALRDFANGDRFTDRTNDGRFPARGYGRFRQHGKLRGPPGATPRAQRGVRPLMVGRLLQRGEVLVLWDV